MDLVDFFDKIDSDEEIEGKWIKNTDGSHYFFLFHHPTKLNTKISEDAIYKNDWDLLHGVITGNREPTVLQHMSRVVGYYSMIENWNKSKIGELKSRHLGKYSF